MQTRYNYLLRFILAISDLILVNICFFVAAYISSKYFNSNNSNFFRDNLLTSSFIWVLTTSLFRLYSESTLRKFELIYRNTWKSVCTHWILFLFYIFITDHADFPRSLLLSFFGLMVIAFIFSRFIGTALEGFLTRNFDIRKTVAVLGRNQGGYKLANYLEQQSSLNFMGFLDEDGLYIDQDGELVPSAAVQFKAAAEANIKEVYVSLMPDRLGDIGYLLKEAEKQCVRIKLVPYMGAIAAPFNIAHMGSFHVMSVRNEPLESLDNRFRKRVFDVMFSSLVIIFVLSWLYPLLALIIKIQSPGPVLFKQLRSGRDNKPFFCYKFRSMRVNKDSEKVQASQDDVRVTPIGRFMRKTSLDEFPQFINVFMGNMSILGPRPHMLSHTEQYRALIDQYMVRQYLKPGISGWAQVNGYRGETREPELMQKRVEHDIWYMENWSAMLDIKIVFMTLINMIKGEEKAF